MTVPKPRPDPDNDDEVERERRRALVADFIALRERIHQRHPELAPEDWAALADEWSNAVAAGLRERMRLLDEHSEDHQTSCGRSSTPMC